MSNFPFITTRIIENLSIFITVGFLSIDWYLYFKLKKIMMKPFQNFKFKKNYTPFSETEKLYLFYKLLNPKMLKIAKLHLKGKEFGTNIAIQLVDLITKLVFTIGLALFGLVITTSNININFLNSDAISKKQIIDWYEKINASFEVIISGINGQYMIFVMACAVFLVASNHSVVLLLKQKLQKQHLTVIEEVEKKLS